MPVVVIVADGARPDTFAAAMNAGELPGCARLRVEGGLFTVTTCAPSVTGPAYAPFLLGRYPAPVGLPGIRWYDRARRACRLPGHSRSYVGWEMRFIDDDLEAGAPTLFELVPSSIGARSVITRGLKPDARIGQSALASVRAGFAHFRGDVPGWLALDREAADAFADRVAAGPPDFAFAALTGIDKTSHAAGQDSAIALEAMRIVDDLVNRLRAALEERSAWEETHVWIVSDHGHVRLREHEDLARLLEDWGHRTRAHPWVYTPRREIAVMVSGNAMAHLYLDIERRDRPWWPALAARWEPLVQQLLARESVDLVLLPHSAGRVEIRARGRGSAMLEAQNERYSYRPQTGDPLGFGELGGLDSTGAHEATMDSDYPDALVQIATLCAAPRSGDLILSATRDWDFRARYEPLNHVSSHGALHRDHMLVPLLLNRPPEREPRRTVDVAASVLAVLGIEPPPGLNGEPFMAVRAAEVATPG